MDNLKNFRRTNYCGDLRLSDAGKTVSLCGWVQRQRDLGGLIFVDLRDRTGLIQLSFDDSTDKEIFEKASGLRSEYVIAATGLVRERESKTNKIATGDIEVYVTELRLLARAETPPFEIVEHSKANDMLRLKYRYLDLRRPDMQHMIATRHKVTKVARDYFDEQGFYEIETPMLTKSTPEGARDYLVPSRKHPGKFYALPQAPQQFKQLLMASGFDKYFQIAPCFRDEDARGDRSPGEFYQLDMEMAFADQEDVFAVLEDVLPPIFAQYGTYNVASTAPFRRISYLEAMDKYGSDKPDLRIDLVVQDATDVLGGCGFGPFEGNTVKAVVVTDFEGTRKQIDKLCADVEVQTGNKAYWFRLDENGELVGGISKFLADRKEAVIEALSLKPGDFVGLAAGKKLAAQKTAGVLRKVLGNTVEGHMNKECYEFCWIVDFPMYEIGEESGKLEFCHNPFSMPQGGMKDLTEKDPLDIYAYQYDLVCNGVELSSGAVRNHDPEIMVKAFELVGLGEDDVKAKFPAMYNAFCYGAPPHAGIAPGVDRMVMLITGEESIREIIPFPMNKTAQDVMMGAPAEVDPQQLKDVHIQVVMPGKEEK